MEKLIKIVLTIIVTLIILSILILNKNTFASFVSNITAKTTTKVANPIFIVEGTDKKNLSDNNKEVDYYFTIKNYNENGIKSQVDLKYIIEILPDLDNSITLTLYKDEEIVKLDKQKTDYISLEQKEKQEHTYRLNIKYDRNKTDIKKDIKEKVYINVKAIQN